MARAVKKVKGSKKISKKFVIILSSVITVLVLVGIGLGVYVYFKNNTEEDTTDFTSFAEYKINYSDVTDVINGTTQHIFIFAYDGKTFDKDENKSDEQIYNNVVKLINAINTKNTNGKIIDFKLIDTSLTGNSPVLSDSVLGNLGSVPALIYIYGDSYSAVTKNQTVNETVSGVGSTKINTYIQDAIEYVQKLVD